MIYDAVVARTLNGGGWNGNLGPNAGELYMIEILHIQSHHQVQRTLHCSTILLLS
jgi:hypothetical protein